MSGVCCCKTRAAREEALPTRFGIRVTCVDFAPVVVACAVAACRPAAVRSARLELCRLVNWHASRSDTDQLPQQSPTRAHSSESRFFCCETALAREF